MATKNVTLRLPEELVEYLTRNNDSVNQAVISEVSYLRRVRQVSLGELRGVFNSQEWMFLADVFNGIMIDDVFCANVGAFISACEDAENYEGKATSHAVDMTEFINKVRGLKGANIEAIYSRIKDYWEHSDEVSIAEWAEY